MSYTVENITEMLGIGKFESAKQMAEEMIAEEPSHPTAHYWLLLSAFDSRSADELAEHVGFTESAYYHNAVRYGNENVRRLLQNAKETCEFKCEKQWQEAEDAFRRGAVPVAYFLYSNIKDYKNSRERLAQLDEQLGDEAMQKKDYAGAVLYYKGCGNAEKLAAANAPLEAVEEFKKLVGNPDTYIERRLTREHPKIMAKYRRLQNRNDRIRRWLRNGTSYINSANEVTAYRNAQLRPLVQTIRDDLRAQYAGRIRPDTLEQLIRELRY